MRLAHYPLARRSTVVESKQERFQILALSGGGFRGLYTAKIHADLEEEIGAPIATRFDLIAGTSIGGILALAIASRIPAKTMVDLFVEHGEEIFKRRFSLMGMLRAPYSANLCRACSVLRRSSVNARWATANIQCSSRQSTTRADSLKFSRPHTILASNATINFGW